jgi:hypothetical protein
MSFKHALVFGLLVLAGCDTTGTRTQGSSNGSNGSPTTPTAPTPPSAPTNISGNWTLAVTASTTCTQIPAAFRRRTYPVMITQTDANFSVLVPSLVNTTPSCPGLVTVNSVNFVACTISEVISNTQTFTVSNFQGTLPISTSNITGRMRGIIQFQDVAAALSVSCLAADHQFAFTR